MHQSALCIKVLTPCSVLGLSRLANNGVQGQW